jgi:hypothetical protein
MKLLNLLKRPSFHTGLRYFDSGTGMFAAKSDYIVDQCEMSTQMKLGVGFGYGT